MAKKIGREIGRIEVRYRYCPGSAPFQASVNVCFDVKEKSLEIQSHGRVMDEILSYAWGHYDQELKCRCKEAWFSGDNWERVKKQVNDFVVKVLSEIRGALKERERALAEKPADFSEPILI